MKSDVFEKVSKIKDGKKVYIVERHFSGKRDVAEAINTAVRNTLTREAAEVEKVEKTA